MILYPSIDIQAGRCVRLYQGSYDLATIYKVDPVEQAILYQDQGAEWLHLIDLDGAKVGKPVNKEIIQNILKMTHLKLQVGGGLRSEEDVLSILNLGVNRVVIGSVAVYQPELVKNWLTQFGNEKIVVALDIRMNEQGIPQIATHGWEKQTSFSLWDWLDEFKGFKLKHVLCTDISRDGTLKGVNVLLYQACVNRYPDIQFQASGGVGSLLDLNQLAEIKMPGAIIGKALYEKQFTFTQALKQVASC